MHTRVHTHHRGHRQPNRVEHKLSPHPQRTHGRIGMTHTRVRTYPTSSSEHCSPYRSMINVKFSAESFSKLMLPRSGYRPTMSAVEGEGAGAAVSVTSPVMLPRSSTNLHRHRSHHRYSVSNDCGRHHNFGQLLRNKRKVTLVSE